MSKKKPNPTPAELLAGDLIDLKAIVAVRETLDLSDKKQARHHIVLGHILQVVASARSVCGVKVEQ